MMAAVQAVARQRQVEGDMLENDGTDDDNR